MQDIKKEDEFDHLVYLRIFEGCNLHCEHCFIPANPSKMTMDQIRSACDYIKSIAQPGETVLIQWHGGEPTAVGVRFFTEAIEIINGLTSEFNIRHGIQTNLIKYNEDWRDLFKKYFDGYIGVSWDPAIRLMKKDDPSSNEVYEELFWKNITQLVEDGIEPFLIVTGTKILFERFNNPFVFMEFFKNKGIRKMHIEKLTKTGYAVQNWGHIGVTNKQYSSFISRLARAYEQSNRTGSGARDRLSISPIDGYFESTNTLLNSKPVGYGCNSGRCDTAYHTIDADRQSAGCTALNTNEQRQSQSQGVQISFTALVEERTERQRECLGCKYKPICSSGCMTEAKTDVSGECSGGYEVFETVEAIIQRRNK
ncbi:radical SAM protein [Vibrio splendidus]